MGKFSGFQKVGAMDEKQPSAEKNPVVALAPTINEAYKDLLQPTAKQIGRTGETLAMAINYALSP